MPPSPVYVFPPFCLCPDERRLAADELPLKLGGRAFDMLLALVERRERIVSKFELLDLVWPKLVVEENNLQVQVVTLRKLLGHHAIATVPGRGYRFTLPVSIEGDVSVAGSPPASAAAAPVAAPPDEPSTGRFPHRTDGLFGRQAEVDAIRAMLRERRVLTIVGAGGIGKTRVAEAAARASAGDFPDGVWWVELASLADPARVPSAVARALGIPTGEAGDTLRNVVARVGARAMLVVLDNCEHLLEGVAAFVQAVVASTPNLRLLLTSQEVLKAGDETVVRLGTLGVPAGDGVDAVATSGAGALLLARVAGAMPGFTLKAANAAAAAEICRRLDGIPLAIELAAARVPLLGPEGVRGRLDERFRMLTAGARAVLRRHQTLRAALDWSHGLLAVEERVVFRRLGVFAGGFTLGSAQRVADDPEIDAWDVLEHLGALVDKSLVLAEGEPVPRYRLLETTRLFALEKLAEAGETEATMRRHAQAIVALIEPLETPAKRWSSTPEDWAACASEIDNMRAALDWALARRPGDTALALGLAAASLHVFGFADVFGEGYERISAFAPLARHAAGIWPGAAAEAPGPDRGVPDVLRARYLLALARIGTQMASGASLEAALEARSIFAALGDDLRRYFALGCAIAIAARHDATLDVDALIVEASALESPAVPPRLRAMLEWARHRWLLRQGRPEDALIHARRQVELTRESGAAAMAVQVEGANVAYCELALGRAEVAAERCRAAHGAGGDVDHGAGHLLDAWSMALAVLGRLDAALEIARRAHADLETSGDAFMLLDGLAWIAAAQGRHRDAVVTMARSDIEFAARRFVRWPLSVEWRRRTEALLAGLPEAERRHWTDAARGLTRDAAAAHALGQAPGEATPTVGTPV